jgi:hypothetical protein
MDRESTKALLGTKAMEDALEAKFQGKNRLADSINSFILSLDKGGGGEKTLAFVLKTLFPIRKIPLNIAKEITSYTAGGVKALMAMRGDFTEENAEYIMKNIGKQGVGTMLFAIGYLGTTAMFGGIPMTGDKKRKPEVEPETAKIGDITIDKTAFHGSAAQMIQLGASYRRLYEKDYGDSHDAIHAGLESIGDNYTAMMSRNIPYIDQPRRILNTMQYGRGVGEVVGNQVRSIVVPQVLQQGAAAQDPYKVYRAPQNIVQDVELGIPGLRETVPEKKQKKHH